MLDVTNQIKLEIFSVTISSIQVHIQEKENTIIWNSTLKISVRTKSISFYTYIKWRPTMDCMWTGCLTARVRLFKASLAQWSPISRIVSTKSFAEPLWRAFAMLKLSALFFSAKMWFYCCFRFSNIYFSLRQDISKDDFFYIHGSWV